MISVNIQFEGKNNSHFISDSNCVSHFVARELFHAAFLVLVYVSIGKKCVLQVTNTTFECSMHIFD